MVGGESGQEVPPKVQGQQEYAHVQVSLHHSGWGQQCLGGWSTAGIARFNTLYDEIVEAKYFNFGQQDQSVKPAYAALETEFLNRLRNELGIEADNA